MSLWVQGQALYVAVQGEPPMRLLLTTPYPLWPESAGGVRRTLGIARALAALGHRVTLLSSGTPLPDHAKGGIAESLVYPGNSRAGHFFNPGFARTLDRALNTGQDLVVAGFPYQAYMLTRVCRRRRSALVYDAHNLEAERFSNTGNPLTALAVGLAESRLVRRANTVLAISEDDRLAFLRRYDRLPILLPNGVDITRFAPAPPDPSQLQRLSLSGKRVVLFCGSFDYRPNREALDFLLRADWPIRSPGLPDTHLLVVGRQPPASAGRQGVVVTGEVHDVVPYLRAADLVLAPLSSGGGTRLKIIEALACGQRVLSTPFGAMGLSGGAGGGKIPGLQLCALDEFLDCLRANLAVHIKPGRNAEGRDWAVRLSWQRLVADIDWQAFADGNGPRFTTPAFP